MIKKILLSAITSGLLLLSAYTFATEGPTTGTATAPIAQSKLTEINPASPDFFVSLMNLKSHQAIHEALGNRANWAQFRQPRFCAKMANPANVVAWMDPAVYQSMMDPVNLMQWIQPDKVMQMISTAPFSTIANPSSYLEIMNSSITFPCSDSDNCRLSEARVNATVPTQNMFDMSAWIKMFQPVPTKPAEM